MKEKVNVQIVIQARMGSTRLPGKILSPFANGSMTVLGWILERAKLSKYANRIVVATTTNPKDDATAETCRQHNCEVVRGSEEDVLNRFFDVICIYPSNIIVQINADEPLFDVSEMDRLVEVLKSENLDYVNNHPSGLPLGTGSEAYTASAFLLMESKTIDPYDHEHVTPYFYNHPELFKQKIVVPIKIHPFAKQVRLTLDTKEDSEFLKQLTEQLGIFKPNDQPTTNIILDFLQNNQELLNINKNIIQKTFPDINFNKK